MFRRGGDDGPVYEDDWVDMMLLAHDGGGEPAVLAYDRHEPVRCALACSRRPLPDGVLRDLAADPSPRVRAAVAGRDGLSDGLLEDLSWDSDPRVLAVLAGRRGLPDGVRVRLARCADSRVQAALGDVRAAILLGDMGF